MRIRMAAVCVVAVVVLLAFAPSAFALKYSPSYYDRIAWSWEYYAPDTATYNCLSYALGLTDRWLWPWDSRPTSLQVDAYMWRKGYVRCLKTQSPKIVAYKPSATNIAHFSRVVSSTTTRAKWGKLEVMTSYSWSPYYTTSYGLPVRYYKKRQGW